MTPPNTPAPADKGFTLIEVMICTLILATGMLGIAGLLGVATSMQIGARESARSMRLAEQQVDQLMKLDFETDPLIAVGGNISSNTLNYFDEPEPGVTVRWEVADGPVENTRILTVRVVNVHAQQYRETSLVTIVRD